jgi:Raf kinase inhibitor-like YbhB/YbcL family protein
MGFAPSSMQLSSQSFKANDKIPIEFTGEGADKSPQLSWTRTPESTKSFAIICHDPDAPLISPNGTTGFVHWVQYNIPADISQLDENAQPFTLGKNDFGNLGYGGPMPPPGHGLHHYYFWILALNAKASLPEGLSMGAVLREIEPNVIGMNRLIGSYERT